MMMMKKTKDREYYVYYMEHYNTTSTLYIYVWIQQTQSSYTEALINSWGNINSDQKCICSHK